MKPVVKNKMEVMNSLFENGNVPTLADILRGITPTKTRGRHTTYTNPSARKVRDLMDIAKGVTSDIDTESTSVVRNASLARKLGLKDAAFYLETGIPVERKKA